MQKASWKREPGSAHASGKTEGVSQALPQPRALVGDFRAHCHRSSLSPPPPAIRPFSLGSFQPLPLFSWVEETSKPQLPLPLLVVLALPWPMCTITPMEQLPPFTAHPLLQAAAFFSFPFLPFCLPCASLSPKILFSLTQTILYISPGKIKDSLCE